MVLSRCARLHHESTDLRGLAGSLTKGIRPPSGRQQMDFVLGGGATGPIGSARSTVHREVVGGPVDGQGVTDAVASPG